MFKNIFINQVFKLGLAAIFSLCSFNANAQALVNNKGALISIKDSALLIVKTNSVNNVSGYISNAGRFIIEEDFINSDTATGGNAKGRYEVERHWENNAVFIADSSSVELYGANQLITGTSITEFHHLQLTGTGIKTQTIDAKVNSHLELNDRELATDSNKMFVLNPSLAAISRSTGFVSSLGDGRLSREMNLSATYLFPVGSSVGTTRYRPIEIASPIAAAKTFEVRMANIDPSSEGFDRNTKAIEICAINPNFYHLIDTTAGNGAVDITFFYDAASDGNWNELAHWETVPEWRSTSPNTAAIVGAFNTLAITGWDTFKEEAYALANPSPAIDSAQIADITCFGGMDGSIKVNVTRGVPSFTYGWNIPSLSGDSVFGLSAGTYTLTISDANNCETSQQFILEEADSIALIPNTQDVTCFAEASGAAEISVQNAISPYSITWSNSETSASINNLEAGVYAVEVVDSNNCKSSLEITVNQPEELLASVGEFNVSCLGAEDGNISVNVSGGVPNYEIAWNTGSNAFELENLSGGSYSFEVRDSNNCVKIDTLQLFEPEALDLELSEDLTISLGSETDLEVILTAGGTPGYEYTWEPELGLNSSTGEYVIASPDSSTNYIVTATDINGCTKKDSVYVTVKSTLYVIPEAFTPNGDGHNDNFEIILSEGVKVLKLNIYNRWGELIFSNNANGWNGRYKGSLQASDTYLYQAELELPNGTKVSEAGDFVLVQ